MVSELTNLKLWAQLNKLRKQLARIDEQLYALQNAINAYKATFKDTSDTHGDI